MKITKVEAASREDILKQREEYDAETQKFKDKADADAAAWDKARYESEKAMEKAIADEIGTTSLTLHIRADIWGHSFSDGNGWDITINVNENNKFDDNVALSWSWEAYLDKDGNVKKDSSSWSGLKAVTAEQIADLEESVRVIKTLNNMDWKDILNRPKARWSDYHDEENAKALRDRKNARPDFEAQVKDVRLEELVGQPVVVGLDQDQYYNGKAAILLTGMSDKFLKGYIVPVSVVTRDGATVDTIKEYAYEPRRTAKSNLSVGNDGGLVTWDLNNNNR